PPLSAGTSTLVTVTRRHQQTSLGDGVGSRFLLHGCKCVNVTNYLGQLANIHCKFRCYLLNIGCEGFSPWPQTKPDVMVIEHGNPQRSLQLRLGPLFSLSVLTKDPAEILRSC